MKTANQSRPSPPEGAGADASLADALSTRWTTGASDGDPDLAQRRVDARPGRRADPPGTDAEIVVAGQNSPPKA